MKRKYKVSNMMCASCVSHVKKAAEEVKGVSLVEVNLLTETMNVIFDETITSDEAIILAVEKEGYGCQIFKRKIKMDEIHSLKKMKTRIIVSFIFMVLLMYVSMSHMLGLGLPFGLSQIENSLWFALLEIVLLIPIIVFNCSYFINGFKKLFTLKPNMDSLISIGAIASILYGIFATIMIGINLRTGNLEIVKSYRHDLYFESAGTILTLITFGKFLESRSKKKTTESLEKIMALTPKTAILYKDGSEIEIPVENIMTNDQLIVKAGMSVPVDGEVISGSGSLNESIITGESIPIDKVTGDKVIAGSTNLSGHFIMRAESICGETTVDRILDLVEEAASSKAPISRLADKISAVFVPIVIAIASITGTVWAIFGNKDNMALNSFISVLVISCPCSLGLATPVAIMVATGKAAEHNILVKSAESLELCHKISMVLLDKTGTITKGKMIFSSFKAEGDENDFLKTIGMIESNSLHPLSIAIINYCQGNNIAFSVNDESTIIPGQGLRVRKADKIYFAGNSDLMSSLGIRDDLESITLDLAKKGENVIYFATEHQFLGYVSLQDEIRDEAKEAIELFEKNNIKTVMVTGDNEDTARTIAKKVGITDVYAKTTPNQKAQIITSLQATNQLIAFVGDGVNDAVALTTADIGIAIGTGSDVAASTADVILPHNDLRSVTTLVKLSKKTINNIKMNLFWAFFYNCAGILIATGVFYPTFNFKLNPMIAALAMSLSSFCVVMNALRLRFFKMKIKGEKNEKNN